MFSKKLKAGALQYTIFISVLIALLVTSFIGLSYLHQKLRIKASFFQETILNSANNFNHLTSHNIPYNQVVELDFSEKKIENNVTLYKKPWGVFDVLSSNSKVKNEHFEKIALIGGHQLQKPALFLKENNKPLILVGTTEIRGTCLLPKRGVRRGNIAGHSYYGTELIYGNVNLSTPSLPEIANKIYLEQLSNGYFLNHDFERFELKENLKLTNSFSNSTLLFESSDFIDLRFISLGGNIIIQSYKKIIVSKSTMLEDVILIAPIIEIRNEVTSNFQAFATEQIIVGENCNLTYPSALVLNEKKISSMKLTNLEEGEKQQKQTFNRITISSNSIVKGVVSFFSKRTTKDYTPQILIEENAIVVGEVYCEKNIDLQGTVLGSVYTNHFIAMQSGSVYINHIFNGKIIEPDLAKQYCGLQFDNTINNVAKWLY